jgi:hypothetical protein
MPSHWESSLALQPAVLWPGAIEHRQRQENLFTIAAVDLFLKRLIQSFDIGGQRLALDSDREVKHPPLVRSYVRVGHPVLLFLSGAPEKPPNSPAQLSEQRHYQRATTRPAGRYVV